MAKQVKEAAKKPRKAKAKSQPIGPDGLHDLADQLRQLADEIDGYAASQQHFQLGPIKPLLGNFNNACKAIRDFNGTQIVARLIPLANKRGVSVQELLKLSGDSKNS